MEITCNCKSYNGQTPENGDAEVVLPFREWFPNARRETVCIDACIVNPIKALWSAGIETAGSCCGHSGRYGPPQAFLVYAKDVPAAVDILSCDGRDWHVLVWATPKADTTSGGE